MIRGALAAAAAVVVLAASPGDDAYASGIVATGAHYRLESTGPQAEADDWLRMLEAAWPQYEAFFGAAPKLGKGETLRVAFFETQAEMQRAIRDAGGTPPNGAGGYYDPGSRTAFAWRQPSPWYTRTLVLHECAHQFHRLARVGANVTPPEWYGEGVVEHLSQHTWDGEHLRLAVTPLLSLEDRPGKALEAVKSGAFRADAVIDGRAPAERPPCMYLVRWLCEAQGGKLRGKFDALAAKMDRGAKAGFGDFEAAVGPWKKRQAEFLEWLTTVQQPWEPLFVDWDARGEAALRGSSTVVAICRRRAPSSHVAANLHPPSTGAWRGGVLLAWTGPRDYVIGMVHDGSKGRIDRLEDGAWKVVVETAVASPADGAWHVEAVRDGGSVAFRVNGVTIGDVETQSASLGLAIDACTADFTEIEAR